MEVYLRGLGPEVYTILPYTIIGIILVNIFAEKLNILILGDDVARGLGLNVEAARLDLLFSLLF